MTCGICEHRKNGDLIFCKELKVIGFDLDRGNTEYLAVPKTCLRLLPEDIPEELDVIIGDALGTPYKVEAIFRCEKKTISDEFFIEE